MNEGSAPLPTLCCVSVVVREEGEEGAECDAEECGEREGE